MKRNSLKKYLEKRLTKSEILSIERQAKLEKKIIKKEYGIADPIWINKFLNYKLM